MKITKLLKSFMVIGAITMTLSFAGTMNNNVLAASTPTSLSFNQNSANSCTISWGGIDNATYNVYEAVSRYASYSKVDTVSTNSYTDNTYTGGYYKVTSVVNGQESDLSAAISYEISVFGYDTYIFEDTDSQSAMQSQIDSIFKTTEAGQFGTGRHAFLFTPGTYSNDLVVKTGYYTQVAGLGISPEDTVIGNIKCPAEWMKGRKPNGDINYNALCNFWRTCENLTTTAKDTMWAVSQATSMRRMNIKGDLSLQQQGGYASGGFLADTKVTGEADSRNKGAIYASSQQQWLTRNTSMKLWQGNVWNYVFLGCGDNINGATQGWPAAPNTVIPSTPKVQEKPFLTVDDNGAYGVFVPEMRTNAVGVSWDTADIKGETISLDKFYVAKPSDSATTINAQLAAGKNLILTPGIYNVSESINVTNPDTIVLGLGIATIKPTNGNQCMTIADVDGVILAGVLFDAGQKNSSALLTVGSSKTNVSHASNPISLCDTFYRVGGADSTPCKCTTCVVINSNDVIGDNFWIWRADHGQGVGWDKNTSDHGIIINGDNVSTYGLLVEHFQKYQTIWNGENGKCYMYQSELPYDIPSQNVWNAPGTYGYADYKVGDNVKSHEAYGVGIYSCYQKGTCFLKSAVECPDTENVKFTNVCTYSLSGNGSIDYAINKSGYAAMASGEMCKVMSYSNGKSVQDKSYDAAKKYIWGTSIETLSKKVYTGKTLKPSVKVTYRGIVLRPGIDYKVSYKNNKKIGKGTIKVTGINIFKDSSKSTFKIVPAKATVKKKATKKKITLTIKKVKGAKKYQVVYANKKNFKGKKVISTNKLKVKIKRTKKSAYYVKVRAYKKVGKKTYYGKYSKVLKIKKVK